MFLILYFGQIITSFIDVVIVDVMSINIAMRLYMAKTTVRAVPCCGFDFDVFGRCSCKVLLSGTVAGYARSALDTMQLTIHGGRGSSEVEIARV